MEEVDMEGVGYLPCSFLHRCYNVWELTRKQWLQLVSFWSGGTAAVKLWELLEKNLHSGSASTAFQIISTYLQTQNPSTSFLIFQGFPKCALWCLQHTHRLSSPASLLFPWIQHKFTTSFSLTPHGSTWFCAISRGGASQLDARSQRLLSAA